MNNRDNFSMFIDESGIADLTDERYKHFILTSITAPDSELDSISGYFSFIKRKYELEEDFPFHTYDLLENPDSDIRLTPAQAEKFVDSMCEFIDLTPLNILVIHTDKDSFIDDFSITEDDLKGSKENKEKRGIIYYLSSLLKMEHFTKFLKDKDAYGGVYADSRTYQDRDLLEAFINIKQKLKKGAIKNKYYEESRKRLNSITFADKNRFSSGIQLVDFISFVVFARFARKLNSFDEIGLRKVWTKIKDEAKIKNLVDELGKRNIKKYLS